MDNRLQGFTFEHMIQKEKKIIAIIGFSLLMTIGIQVYWNINQYQSNRLMVMNEIQQTFDDVVSSYYNRFKLSNQDKTPVQVMDDINQAGDSIQETVNRILRDLEQIDLKEGAFDHKDGIQITVIKHDVDLDSLKQLLDVALKKIQFKFEYNLARLDGDHVVDEIGINLNNKNTLQAYSKFDDFAGFTFRLRYTNPVRATFIKGLAGLISSLVLLVLVILTVFYLLRIIQKQKQISQIKNDFISNITHEFKTPIATVSTALEALKNFNETPLPEKTRKYLDISDAQLKKLNLLVEKVMETALLEQDKMVLNTKEIDVYQIIEQVVEIHKINSHKSINLRANVNKSRLFVDEFHFEHVISNLVENAVRYGGDIITIELIDNNSTIEIRIEDNGSGIHKDDVPFVFDKFYRSNTFDTNKIKGHGIGLYYSKKIVEFHGGTLELSGKNTFKIKLWRK